MTEGKEGNGRWGGRILLCNGLIKMWFYSGILYAEINQLYMWT